MSSNHTALSANWYLVQCKVRQEERAEENLTRQGYPCLRPTFLRNKTVRGKLQTITESLFPGYLFIQLANGANWGPLRSTRGVLRVVSFGGTPLPIDEAVISQLQLRAEQPAVASELAPGQVVRIVDGPFAELEAIFLSMDGDERVVLLLNFLQREQKVRFPLAGIVKD